MNDEERTAVLAMMQAMNEHIQQLRDAIDKLTAKLDAKQ
jgi:hypothetical protein